MPPRPRKRKVGLTRVDAALDAMAPYGFSKKLVRDTIKSLLKEYGGEEGYVFIEESAYRLLIETILQKTDTNDGDTTCGFPAAGPSNAAPSAGAPEPSCTDSETVNIVAGDLIGAAEPRCTDPETVSTVAGALIGVTEPSCTGLETMNTAAEVIKVKQEPRVCVGNPVSSTPRTSSIGINPLPTTKDATNTQLKLKKAPVARQPCYGWIGCDEEDEQLVELPAVLPDQLCGLVRGTEMRPGKRPSRWDIGPTTRVCGSSPPFSSCQTNCVVWSMGLNCGQARGLQGGT